MSLEKGTTMNISVAGHAGSVANNPFQTAGNTRTSRTGAEGGSPGIDSIVDKISLSTLSSSMGKSDAPQTADEYLEQLRQKNPMLDLTIGANPRQSTQKNTVGISRAYLEKCLSDPEEAARLEKNLGDIPAALRAKESWAARDGVELVGGGMRIDDDGGMSSGYGGMMVTRRTGSSGSSSGSILSAEKKSKSTKKSVLAEYLEQKKLSVKKTKIGDRTKVQAATTDDVKTDRGRQSNALRQTPYEAYLASERNPSVNLFL